MTKKARIIKIIAILIQVIPLLVVLGLYSPIIVSKWDKTVSVCAIIVGILLCCIFKDAVKKFFQRPSGFVISLIIFVFCLIGMSLGEQLLIISATSLISGLVALPLNVWYNYLTRPASAEDIKRLVESNEKNKD